VWGCGRAVACPSVAAGCVWCVGGVGGMEWLRKKNVAARRGSRSGAAKARARSSAAVKCPNRMRNNQHNKPEEVAVRQQSACSGRRTRHVGQKAV